MADWTRTRRLAGACALSLGAALAGFFLLPIVLPFIIGYALAWCVEQPVSLLRLRTGLPRWLCGGVCMLMLFTVTGVGVFFLTRRLAFEFSSFFSQLPDLLSGLSAPAERLQRFLQQLAERAPDGFGEALREWVDGLFSGSTGLSGRLTQWAFTWAGKLVSALPDLLLFVFTVIFSSFMFAADFPATRSAAKKLVPAKWQSKAQKLLVHLRTALGGWVKAQAMLMGITFLVVTAGLMILRVSYPLLFGALVALIDALPLLGTGTVMLPWSLLMFLRGSTRCGIGLLLIYGAATLLRSALEPKLIGRQLGLRPIVTLAAMYAGYRIVGVFGLIVFPIGAILLQQLFQLVAPCRDEGENG